MHYYAHSREGVSKAEWQPLIDHLTSTSKIAAELGHDAGVSELARVAALLHDLGKYSEAFQRRLEGASRRVDHSTAGAQALMRQFPHNPIATLLAYSIVGHHTGLPDYGDATDVENQGTLASRLKTRLQDYSGHRGEIDLAEINLPNRLLVRPIPEPRFYSIAFLTRMVYSALVDADFMETETYMNGGERPRGGYASIATLCGALNEELRRFGNPTTPINRKRTEILRSCIDKAEHKQGLFTLTVPTGGGKTLSSMAFALNHAVRHGLKRIIYVIPYTSIIEQNAAVFKEILGEENVLEHHANFDWEQFRDRHRESSGDMTNNAAIKLKLAAENWDIPIVVTTNVQFFESLYAHQSSRSRKVHNVAKSVIIFDEAQMLPLGYLKPCLTAIRELVTNYGVSAVFCTATQPKLERFLDDLPITELASNPTDLYTFFKRVQVKHVGVVDDETLAERMRAGEQTLCIVNTRRHARGLYRMLADRVPAEDVFHLSTLMCPTHRKATIAEIRARLSEGAPCQVVSTQIMEAGIDVDFPVGYRSMAGLDSIIQAAGRVNREAKRPGGSELVVFDPDSEFVGRMPGYIRQGGDLVRQVLPHFEDPASLDAIAAYFDQLYAVQGDSALDVRKILSHFDIGAVQFEFRSASEKFRLIEDNTLPVIIPYGDRARHLLGCLKESEYPGSLMRRLQLYTVNMYEREFLALEDLGLIDIYAGTYAVLNDASQYSRKTGLTIPESSGGDGIFL